TRVVAAEDPLARHHHRLAPVVSAIDLPRRVTGVGHRPGLDGLLVERRPGVAGAAPVNRREAEVVVGGLLADEPFEQPETVGHGPNVTGQRTGPKQSLGGPGDGARETGGRPGPSAGPRPRKLPQDRGVPRHLALPGGGDDAE